MTDELDSRELEERAFRLYPTNTYMRDEWKKAVHLLRKGRGWVADGATGFRLVPQETPSTPRFANRVAPVVDLPRRQRGTKERV